MGRGVSSGGGQSSLGYLFGDGEGPKPAAKSAPAKPDAQPAVKDGPSAKAATNPQAPTANMNVPAGVSSKTNNYYRPDCQNSGNFITDRPSTKVHAAPGGGSSLGYLFGGGSSN